MIACVKNMHCNIDNISSYTLCKRCEYKDDGCNLFIAPWLHSPRHELCRMMKWHTYLKGYRAGICLASVRS